MTANVDTVDREELCVRYPRLYHVAWAGSVASIKAEGLLNTGALVDLYEVPKAERAKIEGHHRDNPIPLTHARRPPALIRDHGPMSHTKLAGLLDDGLTPADWYRHLDRFAFFWVDKERVNRMLAAYTRVPHVVLVMKTAALVSKWHEKIRLTAFNTGDTRANKRRGYGDFKSIFAFKHPDVVELCVMGGVPDITTYIEAADADELP